MNKSEPQDLNENDNLEVKILKKQNKEARAYYRAFQIISIALPLLYVIILIHYGKNNLQKTLNKN